MRKRLAYINPDCFTHVDLTILSSLAKDMDILWIPIIYNGKSDYSEEYLKRYAGEYGIEIRIVHTDIRTRSPRNLAFYGKLAEIVNGWGCDIVFSTLNDIYWTMVSTVRIKSTIVRGIHDYIQHSGFNKGKLLQLSSDFNILFNKHFIFYSDNQLRLFKEKHQGKHAANVGMVNLDYGMSSLEPMPLTDSLKLLFFGRIDEYKGLDTLIGAMEELYSQNKKKIKLTICGRGAYWEKCKSLISHSELYDLNIKFIDNDEIPDLFMSNHFLVLPYKDATQSGPMMIALNYGIPVIAPDIPAFSEFCDNENSVRYASGNLTGALERCMEMTDPEYRSIKGKWDQVKQMHTSRSIADNYIQFFKEINNGWQSSVHR